MTARLGYTICYVDDPGATVRFYAEAFDLAIKFESQDNSYGELETGGTTLAFASSDLGVANLGSDYRRITADDKPIGIEIAFTVDDVEAAYRRAVASGATSVSTAKVKPWGQTVAYVRDPNGLVVEICTVVSG